MTNIEMIKAENPPSSAPETTLKKKKSIIPKIFSSRRNGKESFNGDHDMPDLDDPDHAVPLDFENKKEINIAARRRAFVEASPVMRNTFSESQTSSAIDGLNLSFDQPTIPDTETKEFRIFVGTWNVGGRPPSFGLNLEDFLQVEGCADIYVCGFQEIVPLSAGNVLVSEDNEPAAKWLALINHALNNPRHDQSSTINESSSMSSRILSKDSKSGNNMFHKPSLKQLRKSLRADSGLLKICNCAVESPNQEKHRLKKLCGAPMEKLDSETASHDQDNIKNNNHKNNNDNNINKIINGSVLSLENPTSTSGMEYSLITSKQMVGIFVTVWARKELVSHIGHLRVSSVGRGIMGCLGNKGCISVSMSLHRTSLCFVCSHLASGEKEGDELRRNADVAEILRTSQFPNICKTSSTRVPERIIDHDRIIWLGDLNYRVSLSYDETKMLLEENNWDTLLEKDQLNTERDAGRVFNGFTEGRILFAPTYKYSQNSDSYAGETVKSKRKRRTPAWCDRILWRGRGITQLSYIRVESRFSDHRPVCGVFAVEVEAKNRNNTKLRKGYSCAATRMEFEDCLPKRHPAFHGLQ
ncbi:type I inositol polyphosphate 5-phosphatase 5 [Euphorbia lathyris]|uniref:type I inositol polyphosphate 5-phosphatase 5 n=1 Tax=Euphorbia lathyris TaxID=212925 RepID=UPI00331322E2